MGEARTKEGARQIAMVCLEELVAADDRYRRIDEIVGDWGFVREAARPYYSDGVGRPSVDPTVLLKLMLAGALEGIGSMRELLRIADLRLDVRLFLGYGFGERLPAHQTISEAQTQRFADGEVFERLFLRTVALCKQHGLIEGSHLSVDGFHAEANAALRSLRASLEPIAGGAGEESPAEAIAVSELPQLRLAEPRSGPTPKRKAMNATAVSTSDPDARLKGKPGQRPHLVHRGQVAVDPRKRCVAGCLAERAEGYEGDALAQLLDASASCCQSSRASAPTRASPPSVSGQTPTTDGSSPTSRRRRRCSRVPVARRARTRNGSRSRRAPARKATPASGRTGSEWPTPKA